MDASTQAIDEAMRRGFDALPDFAKKALLDILGAPGTLEREWWESVLLDFDSIPDIPPET